MTVKLGPSGRMIAPPADMRGKEDLLGTVDRFFVVWRHATRTALQATRCGVHAPQGTRVLRTPRTFEGCRCGGWSWLLHSPRSRAAGP